MTRVSLSRNELVIEAPNLSSKTKPGFCRIFAPLGILYVVLVFKWTPSNGSFMLACFLEVILNADKRVCKSLKPDLRSCNTRFKMICCTNGKFTFVCFCGALNSRNSGLYVRVKHKFNCCSFSFTKFDT